MGRKKFTVEYITKIKVVGLPMEITVESFSLDGAIDKARLGLERYMGYGVIEVRVKEKEAE